MKKRKKERKRGRNMYGKGKGQRMSNSVNNLKYKKMNHKM